MATPASTKETAPVYSKAVLEMIYSEQPCSTPSGVIASMRAVILGDWKTTWPNGCEIANPVELRGVCLKVVPNTGHDWSSVKLELLAAQNTTAPAIVILNEYTQILTLDGAAVNTVKFRSDRHGLAEGTKLYAKKLIAYWRLIPTQAGAYELAWKVIVGKFLTLDQLSRIEDWTNLP